MPKPITVTYSLAMAAAQDAGNQSMRAGGRTKWAVKDWNVACETFERLWGKENGLPEGENRFESGLRPSNDHHSNPQQRTGA